MVLASSEGQEDLGRALAAPSGRQAHNPPRGSPTLVRTASPVNRQVRQGGAQKGRHTSSCGAGEQGRAGRGTEGVAHTTLKGEEEGTSQEDQVGHLGRNRLVKEALRGRTQLRSRLGWEGGAGRPSPSPSSILTLLGEPPLSVPPSVRFCGHDPTPSSG